MIGAVKNEFGPTGNRTKLTDDQFVLIYGVVIQDILFFKFGGIFKIVIESKVSYNNIGVLDNIFEITSIWVIAPRVNVSGVWFAMDKIIYKIRHRYSSFRQFMSLAYSIETWMRYFR